MILTLVVSLAQGVNIYITVWDRDQENQFVPYDLVDEFSFDYNEPRGLGTYYRQERGLRVKAKTE